MLNSNGSNETSRHQLIANLISYDDDHHVDLKRYIRAFDMRLSRNVAFSKIPCGPVIIIDTDKVEICPKSNSKYKTELCKYYVESGACKFQGDCTFAHGAQDLRDGQRKVVLCRLFHMKQHCPYKDHCAFIHDEYRRSSIIVHPGYVYQRRFPVVNENYRRSRHSSSGYESIDE